MIRITIRKPRAVYVKPRPLATSALLIGSAYTFYKAARSAGHWFDQFSESVSANVQMAQMAASVIRDSGDEEEADD